MLARKFNAREGGAPHGRLEWYRPDELSGERRTLYDAITSGPRAATRSISPLVDAEGRLEGAFNGMLVSPATGTALQSLGAALRYRTELSDREREIAILLASVVETSDFEWIAHELVGRAAGLDDADLEALLERAVPPSASAAEATVVRVVNLLLDQRDLTEAEYDAAADALGVVKVMELVTLVGYYQTLALALRVFRVPLPDGMTGRWDDSAPPMRPTA